MTDSQTAEKAEFAQMIRSTLELGVITKAELGDEVGVGSESVRLWARGKTWPPTHEARAVVLKIITDRIEKRRLAIIAPVQA
ncbi:MAG: hypothetical protein ABIA47_01550 [bacterium]